MCQTRLYTVIAIILACAAFGTGANPAYAQVVISEFMAENDGAISDEDGDSPDWIELYNTGSGDVNLAGWSLTDNPGDSAQWVFPDVTLPGSQFMIVFASGKDRRDPESELHANFRLSSTGEYLALFEPNGNAASEFSPRYPNLSLGTEALSYGSVMDYGLAMGVREPVKIFAPTDDSLDSSWMLPGFDDSAWTEVQTSIGFSNCPGLFTVTNYEANLTVSDFAIAEDVIDDPSKSNFAFTVSIRQSTSSIRRKEAISAMTILSPAARSARAPMIS